jgi:alpha-1,2-mannosyltransferase
VATSRLRLTPLAATAAAVALVGAAAALVSWRYLFRFPNEPMVDLQVYERAGDAVRHGRTLYEDLDSQLVFTYPPFAALVATVVAPFTGWLSQFLWTLATVVAVVGVVLLSFRPLLMRCSAEWRPLAVGGLVAVALVSHPVIEHVFYGQVNVFLVLLCLLDVLVLRERRSQGILIGIATSLKLTPGVFAVYLWVTGRRRAALTAIVTAVGCTAGAAIVLPSASVDFWTREVYEGQRIAGSVTYTSNQSLLGVVARIIPGSPGTVVWVLAAVAVAALGFVRGRDAYRAGNERAGVAITALLAVLLSPIAWIHHFVWFVPVVGALIADGRDRRRLFAGVTVTVVLLLRLPWWGWASLDEGPLLGVIGVLMHNAYALLAIGLLLAFPIRSTSSTQPRDEPVVLERDSSPGTGEGR